MTESVTARRPLLFPDRLDAAERTEYAWPSSTVQVLGAAILVAIGSCVRGQLLVGVGLPVTMAGLVVAAWAVWTVDDERWLDPTRMLTVGFAVMALVGLFAPVAEGGLVYDALKRTYFTVALMLVGAWPKLTDRGRGRAVQGLVIFFALVQLGGPFLVPKARIDNWAWTQAGLRALFHGIHPYTVSFADVPGAEYGRHPISGYPYPPLTLVALAPAFAVFGDFRPALSAAIVAAVLLLRMLGRELRVGANQLHAATLVILLNPRSFTATNAGHIEPLMALALIAFACLAARRASPFAQALAFWMAPALKQYFVAPALLFLGGRTKRSLGPTLLAGLVVLAAALPFFWWNASATWHGLWLEVAEWPSPDRDATSITAVSYRLGLPYAGRYLAPVTQVLVGCLAGWRLRDAGLGGFFLASAVSLLGTFLIAWQGYPHYYLLVTVLLALSALSLSAGTANTTGSADITGTT